MKRPLLAKGIVLLIAVSLLGSLGKLSPVAIAAQRGGCATIKGIRYWSGEARTRIVIDLDRAVVYTARLLNRDVSIDKPPRLYIDLKVAKLPNHLREPIPISSGLLKQVRAGQYDPATVRVVLDLESVADYTIFPLQDPFRVVIDILGAPTVKEGEGARPTPLPPPSTFRLVLDPGHGGEDPGAIGPTGLKEKDVCLKIAHLVKGKIKKALGWEVVMTREDDRFLPLEDRTAIANSVNGNLFVSIHANAAPDRHIRGVETYIIGTTKNRDILRLAAKENNISPQQVSDLQMIITDLKLNDPQKVIPSRQLADAVQTALLKNLKRFGAKDLGVKQAPFVVLWGADIPSILVEVSFISNPDEERRLRDQDYLYAIADAMVEGLQGYAYNTIMAKRHPFESTSTSRSSN